MSALTDLLSDFLSTQEAPVPVPQPKKTHRLTVVSSTLCDALYEVLEGSEDQCTSYMGHLMEFMNADYETACEHRLVMWAVISEIGTGRMTAMYRNVNGTLELSEF